MLAEGYQTVGLAVAAAPRTWLDAAGKEWPVPLCSRRTLNVQIPCHRRIKEFVLQRDGRTCRRCGATRRPFIDHILSVRNGGSHHPDNLQVLCPSCNSSKAGLVDRKVVA